MIERYENNKKKQPSLEREWERKREVITANDERKEKSVEEIYNRFKVIRKIWEKK